MQSSSRHKVKKRHREYIYKLPNIGLHVWFITSKQTAPELPQNMRSIYRLREWSRLVNDKLSDLRFINIGVINLVNETNRKRFVRISFREFDFDLPHTSFVKTFTQQTNNNKEIGHLKSYRFSIKDGESMKTLILSTSSLWGMLTRTKSKSFFLRDYCQWGHGKWHRTYANRRWQYPPCNHSSSYKKKEDMYMN